MASIAELNRADHAKQIAENPLLAEALTAWETEILQAWQQSPLRDVEGRERLRLMLEASKCFRQYLDTTIRTGQMAKVEIERERSKLERVKAWAWPQ
jgi:hypothetical protein